METTSERVRQTVQRTGTQAAGPARARMGQVERMASAVLGSALLALGLRRRTLGRTAMTLASGGLLYRGLSGGRSLLPMPGPGAAGRRLLSPPRARAEPVSVERTLTIGRPAEELQRMWREPHTLARIMGHFADVTEVGPGRTHWRVTGPRGASLEWDSRVVEDRPGEVLRWESVEGAALPNAGAVRFRPAPGEWGTEVTLSMGLRPLGGALGETALRQAMQQLSIVPRLLVLRALRRCKSLAETGEVPTLEHNPSARRGAGST